MSWINLEQPLGGHPVSWWALYTGLISYGLIGLLFAGEWLIRQRVRRFE